jgi:superfamily I DNA and/or RNA helicase
LQQQTLRLQYRMPPALLEHPSKYFYNGLVQSANSAGAEHVSPAGFAWPVPHQPLAFVQVGNGDSEIVHKMGGRSNPTEATLAADIVYCLLQAGEVPAANIAILTPYSKQVQVIRSALEQRSMLRQGDSTNVSLPHSFQQQHGLRTTSIRNILVATIDSFQGQETDVVVFSAVRSNTLSELGFLRDRRRLCVAITRARRGLIILGDATVLRSCRHWQALIENCRCRHCFVDARSLKNGIAGEKKSRNFDQIETKSDEGRCLENENGGIPEILNIGNDAFYGIFSMTNRSDIFSLLENNE